MEQKEAAVIMYESPEAAREVVMMLGDKQVSKGYLSVDNYFYKEENMARYQSATHKLCDCGVIMKTGYTHCERCQDVRRRERYFNMPFKEWDGKSMICVYNDDRFFRDQDDFNEWCEDNDVEESSVMLVLCEENHLTTISSEYWSDIMPDDGDGELPEDVQGALNSLNEVIKKSAPISYSAGKIRTGFKDITAPNLEVSDTTDAK